MIIQHKSLAEEYVSKSRHGQYEFWTELISDQPELSKLTLIGADINQSIVKANYHYKEAMKLNRESPIVILFILYFIS